ncbi:hypothetical protein DL93DRAFT_2226385 [Clavulina sp. PMI_390]|nr:hypothetical protein DL93DRAFT_2226385 [Clavulina sp. PMI_390]
MLTRLVAGRSAPLQVAVRNAGRSLATTSRAAATASAATPELDERPAIARLESLQPSHGAHSSSSALSIAPAALTTPLHHPKTHGIPVGILHLSAYDTPSLSLFIHFILHAAYAFGLPASRAASLPNKRSLYTVIRSPFVHKKSQENFERIVHRRAIKIWDSDMEVFNKWARYLELNAMPGVDMRFVRWERVEVGFGAKRLAEVVKYEEELWNETKGQDMNSKDAVSRMAKQIQEAEIAAARAADMYASPKSSLSTRPSPAVAAASPASTPSADSSAAPAAEPSTPTPNVAATSSPSGEVPSATAPKVAAEALNPESTSTPAENIPVAPQTKAPSNSPSSSSSTSSEKAPNASTKSKSTPKETVVAPADVKVTTPESSTPPPSSAAPSTGDAKKTK